MAKHTYSKCLIHIVWGTKKREPVFDKHIRNMLSEYLHQYSESKKIHMYVNYVNADHVHVLFNLPTTKSIQEVAKLYKGSSSFWINKNGLTSNKFSWARGYGAFSVSRSHYNKVKKYILNQEEHHRKKSFSSEFSDFLNAYNINANNR